MINGRKVLAIIPARKGSQGLQGKNYLNLNGKPLLFWSINASLESDFIDIVCVSTNDEIIISKTKQEYNNKQVRIIERPDSISGESSKTEEAMIHAVNNLQEHGLSFDIVCLLQPTSPFRKNNLVSRCLQEMVKEKRDSVITVSKHTPFFWKYKSCNDVEPLYSLENRPMRQDLEKGDFYYHDNGNFYACEVSLLFSENPRRVGNNPVLIETSFIESLQIDTIEDFEVVEVFAKLKGIL